MAVIISGPGGHVLVYDKHGKFEGMIHVTDVTEAVDGTRFRWGASYENYAAFASAAATAGRVLVSDIVLGASE